MDARLKRAIETGTLPKDLLVCGPAGTGKTRGILNVLHTLAADYPRLRILICRQVRASMPESTLITYEQEVLPADGMEHLARGPNRENRQRYTYPNRSTIVVVGLDKPGRALSTSWDVVYVNEAIELNEDAWEHLGGRLDRPGRDNRFGWLIGDTNPGAPHHWLLSRCKSGKTAYWDTTHQANPALFDGTDWTDAGRRYLARLDRYTGTRRLRYRDGLWAVGEGLWFGGFDPDRHVSEDAEYDPSRPVYLAVDPGVFTGAVLFQAWNEGRERHATVFADYLVEDRPAQVNARALLALVQRRAGGRCDVGFVDPAGGARTAVGPTVLEEYAKVGLRLKPWPLAPVADGLELIETLLTPSVGLPRLTVHPRCEHLIGAFQGYMRAKRANQWMDYPEDPQHPYEDVMDALRGGLFARFPGLKVLRRIGP